MTSFFATGSAGKFFGFGPRQCDAPFAPDANAHDLAAGGPRRGVARSEDVMATEPSERRRADERQAEIDEISQHIDPRRRRHLESAGLGHLFG